MKKGILDKCTLTTLIEIFLYKDLNPIAKLISHQEVNVCLGCSPQHVMVS